MPYIVTTSTSEECEGGTALFLKPVSRRAVATLDEVQRAERHLLYAFPESERTISELGYTRTAEWVTLAMGQIADLDEQGGTIGPLPDSTVIEVEQIGWMTLAHRAAAEFRSGDQRKPRKRAEIIDAYNAAQ